MLPLRVPSVSIVIGAFNCERFLGETLRSIQAQSVTDWECIVIDDGSQDRTHALAAALAANDKRIRVETRDHEGSSSARNYGFSLTNPGSKYICFMDSDDVWSPEALRILSEQCDQNPDAVGSHGIGRCIDECGNPHDDPAYTRHGSGRVRCDRWGRLVEMPLSERTSFASLWFSNPFPPGLVIAKRSAYEKAGLFDAVDWTVRPFEDWDMLLRLSRLGDFHFSPSTILLYRRHSKNLSARSAATNSEKLLALQRKTFFAPENSAEQRRILRNNWRSSQLFHLRHKWRVAVDHSKNRRLLSAARVFAGLSIQLYRLIIGHPARKDRPLLQSEK